MPVALDKDSQLRAASPLIPKRGARSSCPCVLLGLILRSVKSEGYLAMNSPAKSAQLAEPAPANIYSSPTTASSKARKQSLAVLGTPTDSVDFPLGPPDDTPMTYGRRPPLLRKRSV